MFTQVYAAVRGRLREMKENDGDVAQPVPAVDLNNPTPGTSSASGSALALLCLLLLCALAELSVTASYVAR